MHYEEMYILGPDSKLGPGVDYGGAQGAHASPYPRRPWMLGQRNVIQGHSVDRRKCSVEFKSFGIRGSNLSLPLQAVGVGLGL